MLLAFNGRGPRMQNSLQYPTSCTTSECPVRHLGGKKHTDNKIYSNTSTLYKVFSFLGMQPRCTLREDYV